MLRGLLTFIWLLLSAWLLIWVGEGLFGVDQRTSILPFSDGEGLTTPILVGVAWGILLTLGQAIPGARKARLRGDTKVGLATIVEIAPTGVEINDRPQVDLFVRVRSAAGDDAIAALRTQLAPAEMLALQPGMPLPVRYSPSDPDTVQLADLTDPAVRSALLDWRIERGLIEPRQVRARKEGTAAPASVVSVRPTGRRKEGQSELALRVLVTPDGAASWETDTSVFVYPDAVGRLQVGSPIWALYRREDPMTVAVIIEKEDAR